MRDELFVIDKIDDLKAPVAPQIDESLRRLQLEHTDAFVFHALSSMEIFERLAAPGGGFDQLADCIRRARRAMAASRRTTPTVLRAAIECGAVRHRHVPGGAVCGSSATSSRRLPLAQAPGVGTVCFKTFGAGKLLGDTQGYNQPLQLRPRGKLSRAALADDGGAAAVQRGPNACTTR